MSDHGTSDRPIRRPRGRRGSGRARALMSLAAVAVLATGVSVKGTFAFWTDSATLQTGSFSSGTLDVTLGGQLTGQGGTWSPAGFSLTNLVPGESQAFSFAVANAGTVGLTYTVSGTATGGLAPSMQFSIHPGTASNSGTAAAGNRTGSCTGAALATNVVLSGTATTLVGTPRSLAAGSGTENICVIARLDPAANNSAQGLTMSANLVFDSRSVGA